MARGTLLFAAVFALTAVAAAGDADPIRRDLELHAGFLGSPELGGFVPGTPGYATAVKYIEEELARLGWPRPRAIGSKAYLHLAPRPEDCTLLLRRRLGTTRFTPGSAFRPLGEGRAGDVTGAVIFVRGHADLSDSVKGRIVLIFSDLGAVATEVGKHGPAAVLVARDPRTATVDRVTFADGRTAVGEVKDRGTEFLFTDRATGRTTRLTKEMVREIELDLPPGPPGSEVKERIRPWRIGVPVVGVSAEVAGAILGEDLAELLAGVDAGVRPRIVPAAGGTVRVVVPKDPPPVVLYHLGARRAGTDRLASRAPVSVRALYRGDGHAAAVTLALAAEMMRGRPGLRPVGLTFTPAEIRKGDPGVIEITAVGTKKRWRVPVGRPGEWAAAVAAVRVAARIVTDLANVPLPKPKPRMSPPAPKAVSPPPPKGTLAAARRARLAGRLDAADRELAVALAKTPKDPAVRTERGRVLIARKKWEEALAEVRAIEAFSKTDGRADHLRFEIHEARREHPEAAEALVRARNAEYPEAMIDWTIRMPLGEPGALLAIRPVLRKLVTSSPESAWGKYAAGLHLYSRRDLAGAERYLDQTVKLDPLLGSAWFWRGKVRSENGRDPTEAAEDFDRAARFGFDRPSVNFERGLCRLRARMYTLAIREFETYLKEVPGSADALYNVACAHALMRNTDEALDWLGRSIEAGFADPDHARKDPDLSSIRSHPRFEALLKSRRTD